MPELPEVETTVRALCYQLPLDKTQVTKLEVRQPHLRWEVPQTILQAEGEALRGISRRAKYILLHFDNGTMVLHLGMSGRLRLLKNQADIVAALDKHTHFVIHTTHGAVLLRDPRKFGFVLWYSKGEALHRLQHLGIEPLSQDWSSDYLYAGCHKRKLDIKRLIMDQKFVVGIGNIYATESLFRAGIHPHRTAGDISKKAASLIVEATQLVLMEAIECGGTSLKDFYSIDNKQGYFVQKLRVYGRHGQPCHNCATVIVRDVRGGRSDFFCPSCQK